MPRRRCPTPPEAERPVLVVQGLACHSGALGPLRRRIRRYLGRPTLCFTRAVGLRDLRDTALQLREATERAAAETPFERIDIVAHSMGGLVSAYFLKCIDQGRRVRRVVALGTPFAGAPGASWVVGPFGRALRQIAPGSAFLRLVNELPVPEGSALVSIRGTDDWLVPKAIATLPDAPGHHHFDVAADHLRLLLGARPFASVETALTADLDADVARSARRSAA